MQKVLIRVLAILCFITWVSGKGQSQTALDSLELLTSNCYQKAAPGVVAISIEPLEADSSVESATMAGDASAALDLKHVGDELMGELFKRIMGATHEADSESIGLTREDIRTGIYRHVESASGIGLVAHEIDAGTEVQSAAENLTANEGAADAGADRVKTAGTEAGVDRTRATITAANGRKGTGFIVREDGTIVTIGDLFRGFGENRVRIVITYYDGQTGTAVLRGIDPHTNIAVLRSDLPGGKALAVGDSRNLRVGRLLVAVTCPYGLPPSAQVGIVSGLDRKIGPLEKLGTRYERYIQTDLPLHPGGHGGPVLDRSERVVGMMAATVRQGDWSEVTFAIPSDILVPIVDEIIERGSVARGYLGVSLAAVPLGDKLFSDPGVIISEIEEGSPAALANLNPGDRILRVGNMETNNTDEFVWSIARHRPGESVALSVFREGRQLTIPIILSARDGAKN